MYFDKLHNVSADQLNLTRLYIWSRYVLIQHDIYTEIDRTEKIKILKIGLMVKLCTLQKRLKNATLQNQASAAQLLWWVA